MEPSLEKGHVNGILLLCAGALPSAPLLLLWVLATFIFGADARFTILAAGVGAVAIPSVVFALGIAYHHVRNRASSQ